MQTTTAVAWSDVADPVLQTHPHVLREYSLLADGERGALVGPRGDVAWLCFPGWDGDPVFASLLGAASRYAVHPAAPAVWGGYYEHGTLIWRSRWSCGGSIVESREALAFPGDPRRAVLLRRIEPVRGPCRMAVAISLRTEWGRRPLRLRRDGAGTWTGEAGGVRVRWSGAGEARDGGEDLLLCLDLDEGDHHDLVLEIDRDPLEGPPPDPGQLWRATEAAWRAAVPAMRTAAPRDARHAYAVLRGLTTAGGGMVACATTSLPERASEGRDYDYRYVWIRDQCYAGEAAAAVGGWPLLDCAVRFTAERLLADGPHLLPAYRGDGTPLPEDEDVAALPGYPGAPEVHCGNNAGSQFQLDAFGEALLLLATAAEHDRADGQAWRAARAAAEGIARRWREPDAGLWELDQRLWAHSRLICVAGLRRVAAAPGAPQDQVDAWRGLAGEMEGWALQHCVHPSGRWQRNPEDKRVDASLLLAAVRGAVPAQSPLSAATVEAVRRELSREHFVYRYRHHDRDLEEAEGAFLLCGFWMSLASLQQGDVLGAVRWFERGRTACGPPGLFSEEYDVRQRQLRGNLPQAFVHALLMECAARLAPHAGEEL